MYPHLFKIPVYVLTLLGVALLSATIISPLLAQIKNRVNRTALSTVCILCCAALGGWWSFHQSWGQNQVPVQGYGMMILLGFLCGVWLPWRRSHLLGVDPKHCVDIGVWGVMLGLAGARVFHVLLNWPEFDPFHDGGFDFARVARMFKLWEGGLVFYGAFICALLWTWFYCKHFKLPALPFLDLSVPGLISGLALGRIGCFLNGCCYGNLSSLPWHVRFPRGSPAYEWQVNARMISPVAPATLAIHPTQLYASLAAGLSAAFLYFYWPMRKYDGQIVALMLMMAGASRFFEEILRADDVAAFPSLSQSMTIAQWLAIPIFLMGIVLLFYFRNKDSHFKPLAASVR